jgi:5'-nucleotidase
MRILVSNDDGVHAKGMLLLAEELKTIAEVVVIAPDRNRSGASNSLSVQGPVRVYEIGPGRFSVIGTPTDCVHLALTGFFDIKFDMVISGVNHGANLGDDILYSGTVAAATEGRVLGMPALAISLASKREPQEHFATAVMVARQLVEKLRKSPLPAGTILNVNVPDVPLEELRGFEITRLGRRHIAEPAIKALDPRGAPIYWIGEVGPEEDAGAGTDFHAVNTGKVSITPLQIDMTNYNAFDMVGQWILST